MRDISQQITRIACARGGISTRLEPDLFSALPHAVRDAYGQDGEVFAAPVQPLPAAPDEAGRDDPRGDGPDDALDPGGDRASAAGAPDSGLASAAAGGRADVASVHEHAAAAGAVETADAPDEAVDDKDRADAAAAGADDGRDARAATRTADHDADDAWPPEADDEGAARGA
jgi:hypothetical protein